MNLQYRKSAPAVRSHVLYTADVPASWDIVVDGVVRGHVVGYAPQYGSGSYYRVEFDGVRLSRTGLDKGYVSRVINGRQEPGPQVLEVLGFERVVTYRSLQ